MAAFLMSLLFVTLVAFGFWLFVNTGFWLIWGYVAVATFMFDLLIWRLAR